MYEQLPREKRICDICKGKVEDEQHFILECKLNKNLRQDLFSDPEIKHIQLWNETEKINIVSKQQANLRFKKLQKLSLIPLKNTENTQIRHRYIFTDNLFK